MEAKSHYEKYGRPYYQRNKEKELERAREYYKQNPDKKREAYLKKRRDMMRLERYGLTRYEYEVLLENQEGKCAVCKAHPSEGRSLDVDHCHTSGKVRGLLCNNCNRGIGHLQDSPELLNAAVDYLKGVISGKGGVCGA